MKNTIHLVLISTQAVPNITPVLDQRFRPDQVIMLVSKDMQERADYLERVFKPRGINVIRWLINDAWDIEHIRNRVMELFIEYETSDIVLNATCGTKPMSIAAYEVFRASNKPIFYIHPDKDRLIWMYPQNQPSADLSDRIKLKEYLLSYGATHVNEVYKEGVMPSLRDLTQELIDNITMYAPVLSSLNYYAAKADNPQLRSPKISQNEKHAFWQLVALFQQAKLLVNDDSYLIFQDEASRFLVNGGWLEMHAYACCLDLKKEQGIQDIARSVEVSRKHKDSIVLNELDVAFLQDNRLYLLECKTKYFKGNNRRHDEGAAVLYKLDSLRYFLGGLQAKAMLVSFKPIKDHNKNRAKELKIETCCYEDLQFLQEKLASWLG